MATESPRRQQIVQAARTVLTRDGADGLTMQAVAREVGIRAPSLYKHFADKSEIETALAAEYLDELAQAGTRARTLTGMLAAYRRHALANPALYRLSTERPLPRHALPEALEARAAAPLLRVLPDPDQARAAWAFAHGMTLLEIAGRFPADADVAAAWRAGAAAFSGEAGDEPRR